MLSSNNFHNCQTIRLHKLHVTSKSQLTNRKLTQNPITQQSKHNVQLTKVTVFSIRAPHRSYPRLESRVSVDRRRFRRRGRWPTIDLVRVLHELPPRDYGGLAGPEIHREHLPVTGFHKLGRRPGGFAATALLFLHWGGESRSRILGQNWDREFGEIKMGETLGTR